MKIILIVVLLLSGCGVSDFIIIRGKNNTALGILNAANFTSGTVSSGFLRGTLSASAAQVRARYDGGAWRTATGTSSWKVKLPCMQDDGFQWKIGSRHTIEIEALTELGYTVDRNSWTLIVAQNRDINGDGYGDLAVGADGASGSQGQVYIFHSQPGVATQTIATANATLTGPAVGVMGYPNAVAQGDINGDGYSDVIVGAPQYLGGGWQGRVYVFHSQGTSGIATQAVATADTILTGEAGNDRFAVSVAVGDANGDGYNDVIAGAMYYPAAVAKGRAYIFHSQGASGIASVGAASANTILDGETNADGFGFCVGRYHRRWLCRCTSRSTLLSRGWL